jgi:hypothetical protein
MRFRPVSDIAYSQLWNCPGLLSFKCPRGWDSLAPTSSSSVRFCAVCEREVHYCTTPEEFVAHGKCGHCVAIPDDAVPGKLMAGFLGEPSPEAVMEMDAKNDRIRRWWSLVLSHEDALDPKQASEMRARNLLQNTDEKIGGAQG